MKLIQREFEAICGVLRTPQMAKNGKNRLAILTIFRFRRTDFNSVGAKTVKASLSEAFTVLAPKIFVVYLELTSR